MPEPTVGAIIEKDGKILLTKRNVEPYKGMWVTPGGHIELDETSEAAIIREIKEETNLNIKPRFLFYIDEIMPEIRPKYEGHDVTLFFYAKAEGDVKINEESTEYKWFTPEEALKMKLAFRVSEAIKKWVQSKTGVS